MSNNTIALNETVISQNLSHRSLFQENHSESEQTKIARLIGYTILFIFGLLGNSVVIIAVRTPRMRTVTNVLIANLGLADLLVVLFNIPSVVTYAHLWYWPFGETLCKILPFLQGLTLNASVGTLLAIAVDRYWHIVLYKKRKIPLRNAYKMIVIIWLCSIIIPFPLLINCQVLIIPINGKEAVLCEEVWPDILSRQAYTMIIFLALYLLPLLMLSWLYVVVVRSLKHQPVVSTSREGSHRQIQKDIVRMLVVVVILFAFFWLPYHVVFLYIDFAQPTRTQALVTAILLSQWLVFASSTCNPVVYALMNRNFRSEFMDMVSVCKIKICNKSCQRMSCGVQVAESTCDSSNGNSASCIYESSV